LAAGWPLGRPRADWRGGLPAATIEVSPGSPAPSLVGQQPPCDLSLQAVDVTSSSSQHDTQTLDALTGGAFSAPTSGERSARLREWLATDPSVESMQEVFREMSTRDKGAAKALREKLDEANWQSPAITKSNCPVTKYKWS